MRNVLGMIERYALPEIVGTVATYLGYTNAGAFTHDPVASAYAAAICENLGFYTTMAVQQMMLDRRKAIEKGREYGLRERITTTRDLLKEFGISELLDTSLIRPIAVGIGESLLGEKGIVIGKWGADLLFFIISYIMRKRIEKIRCEEDNTPKIDS